MAQSVDFYRPPILPDPSLRLLDQRGIWALGGTLVLAGVLVLAAVLRLDHLGFDPLGPAEAAIWRDWQKSVWSLEPAERRELLTPLLHESLTLWSRVGVSEWVLRFHSTVWALVVIAVTFWLGSTYLNVQVGALAALFLAVSPLLVAVSHDIGPAPPAAAIVAIHYVCLVGIVFRKPTRTRWTFYLLSGALVILAHPLGLWVALIGAVLAFLHGPGDEPRSYYGRLAVSVVLLGLTGWLWFRLTRPADPLWQPDWIAPERAVWMAPVRVLGASVFWGERVYPSGLLWTLGSAALIVLPLLYGGGAIRHRKVQDFVAFLLILGAAPPILILLAPRWIIARPVPAAEVVTLTLAPLAVWAAAAIRMGLRDLGRRTLTAALAGGGLLMTLWSSRVEISPAWDTYVERISSQKNRSRVVVSSQVAPLADYQHYLGSRLEMPTLDSVLSLSHLTESGDKSLVTFEPISVRYQADSPADSPAPLIRAWLEKNCRRENLLANDLCFQLSLWKGFDPIALRRSVNQQTFYDPAAWEVLGFARWFGPFDPGFGHLGSTTRVVKSEAGGRLGRALVRSHAQWIFQPQQPPGYYHVFIPFRPAIAAGATRPVLAWGLPDGRRVRQEITESTESFSFLWEPLAPNEPLKIALRTPGWVWRSGPDESSPQAPALLFHGVGVRRQHPYVVDLGAPFDDLALGSGWHPAQRDESVSFRWTQAVGEMSFYLPVVGGITVEGQLSLRVAQRQPQDAETVRFEVEWDGRKLVGQAIARREWSTVRLLLPELPSPGRHTLLIRSPSFRVTDPKDPNRQERFGIMVDSVTVQ